ncbi:glucose PTS transporter subunit IIA [Enterococcus thailandicus]|uniref:glucose PTS transporter subunit IIA n=1 Tax=Enterococcus thailandicus TaxID=417368 RepID=UPI0022EBDDA6|nr:glucose PTS transporter subunit IIA [Enterococcus thailandicus]MDA3974052.1 glucose PTS transporter subunit IIA [Enterococcus thailandicus]MDA3976786.1 glucose PTS transporter subunit IIA [Enterococcus thailandicus]MDA3981506.1 glucose PTS transporter subunit IIA [Enterococcus thailandicus]
MDDRQRAQAILEAVGGKENVSSLTHCATRLRFYLNNGQKVEKEEIKEVPGVIQYVESGGQHQVVIGSDVVDIFDELVKLLPEDAEKQVNEPTEKQTWYDELFATISAIFTPYIGVLAAAGILKGFLIPLSMYNILPADSGLYQLLSILASGVFTLLPLFIAVTAANRFKTNQFIALAIAAAMIYPLTDASILDSASLLGLTISFKTYGGAVVPTILAIWAQSYIERGVKKVLPKVTHTVFVPFFTIIITGIAVFALIGPLGNGIANLIGTAYFSVYAFSPILAGALLGGLFQLLVMVGLHWGILPIALINIQNTGADTILPIGSNGVFGQFGAVVGAWLFLRKGKDKEIAASASLSGFFGITEPAIYGINLKYKMPFIIGSISAALGGAISGFFETKAYSFTPVANIFTFSMFVGPGNNFSAQLLANGVSFFVALVATALWMRKQMKTVSINEEEQKIISAEPVAPTSLSEDNLVVAPLNGEYLPISEINDPVFSSKSMGEGFAIKPSEGTVYAPVSGVVELVAQTKHAIGFTAEDGKQLLIHIGLNTVELNGKGFSWQVKQGDRVTAGQVIGQVDFSQLADYDTTTAVVLTNTLDYPEVKISLTDKNHLIQTK